MHTEILDKLTSFTQSLEKVINQFSDEQMNIADKDGEGWTPAQLVHHICDAHTQAYFRIKWMLTENYSIIKPFDQDRWANLAIHDDYHASIDILRGICSRWVTMMRNLTDEQWNTQGWHPEGGLFDVKGLLTYYIDHGEGHLERLKASL